MAVKILVLVCHVFSQDHVIKFGGHKHCGSGDMFLAVEEEDSTRSRLNPPLLLISKAWHTVFSHTKFQNVDIAFHQFVYEVRPVLVTRVYINN